ncbi:sigma 54-interacting transcriptional regulator [Cupriavidus pampae]|uniref:Anaerobic nitric oxide reductase transcription regulator NorR n=1 Tax=Cupriavidus pampae TaxID=659251 RepID=A0ABN7Z9E2_9BURK|nr:sigma 54-interacting transcriptional regulator [Cupriavidus pampae]CAG9180704.1 Anaerobic nitric oxide reductase transcription regulator NorR [Cupriavidus pampae]
MRVVLYQEDASRLRQSLCQHGLPESVDLSGNGEGLLVVIARAHDRRVAAAAEQWLRRQPLPDAFIAACTPATRAHCQPEPWWPASICDLVTADDDEGVLRELALRLARLAELETILSSDWLHKRAVGRSVAWRRTLRAVAEVGRFGHGACLLLGESGCGKELLARLIHDLDPLRRRGPFIVVDCTTLSPELSGSELFGHAKGAFTHAVSARDGAVALADGGTLFLDEIGELDLPLQARLLRVIQERTYKRVGEDNWRKSDFRLTCATNRHLDAEVQAGRFRSDLFFRITQWTIRAPALAERRDDIPHLVEHFLAQHAETPPRVMPEVMQQLVTRDYPGNVRELRHLVLRMADRQQGFRVLSTGCLDLPLHVAASAVVSDGWENALADAVEGALDAGLGLKSIGQIAESIAVQVAERRAGSTSRAAELLRVTPRALQLRRQGRPAEGCP